MTRLAIDSAIALRLVREAPTPAPDHSLVGPSVLRTDALASLFGEARAGRITDAEGRRLLDGVATLKIRLLGDRVSRATAWKLATARGADDPRWDEYVAVAALQADALVTEDPALRAAAEQAGVAVADYDDLFR